MKTHRRAIIRSQIAVGLAISCSSKGREIGEPAEQPVHIIYAPPCEYSELPYIAKNVKDWEQTRRKNSYKSKKRAR